MVKNKPSHHSLRSSASQPQLSIAAQPLPPLAPMQYRRPLKDHGSDRKSSTASPTGLHRPLAAQYAPSLVSDEANKGALNPAVLPDKLVLLGAESPEIGDVGSEVQRARHGNGVRGCKDQGCVGSLENKDKEMKTVQNMRYWDGHYLCDDDGFGYINHESSAHKAPLYVGGSAKAVASNQHNAKQWKPSVLPGFEQASPQSATSFRHSPLPIYSKSTLLNTSSLDTEDHTTHDLGPTLFQRFNEDFTQKTKGPASLISRGLEMEENEARKAERWSLKNPEEYTKPFCEFLTENPTVWHAVEALKGSLRDGGFSELSERDPWTGQVAPGGKYFVSRNGSSLIAFAVGDAYKPGNGVAMIAGHIDALTARLKPISTKTSSSGYIQLGVAPYAGALNSTWWDRDLGIGGRVLVRDKVTGKISTKLVKLDWPIARIPTLAPHFGIGMTGTNNPETEAVPIIGLDGSVADRNKHLNLVDVGTFAATQPPKLVRAIAGELSIKDYSTIVNWELELFDTQPAQTGGLDKDFIFAGRIDDKLCSWPAIEALLSSTCAPSSAHTDSGIIKLVALFDDEEIGSLLKQGARGNFLPNVLERVTEALAPHSAGRIHDIISRSLAHSFLLSADVTHAAHPNFTSANHAQHAPHLNVGLTVCADANGHTTTDAVSTAIMTRVAERCGAKLQVFMGRNDRRSGGTVGPMLSSKLGVRAVDAGMPQLSMHSIRATTGALDPGLGVKTFKGFFDEWEAVDAEFE